MSNYPPGVSGNEYEIAGPDVEFDAEAPCEKCVDAGDAEEGQRVPVTVEGYRGEFWARCENGHEVDWEDDNGAAEGAPDLGIRPVIPDTHIGMVGR